MIERLKQDEKDNRSVDGMRGMHFYDVTKLLEALTVAREALKDICGFSHWGSDVCFGKALEAQKKIEEILK